MIFKEIHQFDTFYSKIMSPWDGEGDKILFTYRYYIPNLVDIVPVVIQKMILIMDNGQRPITIGHLSVVGDLSHFGTY